MGAERHGYFESNPNHDALALNVLDRLNAGKIYSMMKSVEGLFNKYGQVRCVIEPLKRHIELYEKGYFYDVMNGDGDTTPYSDGEKNDIPMLDFFEVPGAGLRGLFECRYLSDRLLIYPHIYPAIEFYEQIQPLRYGQENIYQGQQQRWRTY